MVKKRVHAQMACAAYSRQWGGGKQKEGFLDGQGTPRFYPCK
ncbi:MAG: hypothetical protein V4560_09025 [Bacteroidota bacterium]